MKKKICVIVSLIFVVCAAGGCAGRAGGAAFSDTRYMLDTVCTVSAGGENSEKLVSEVFDLVSRIEGEIDRFDQGSAVSAFNSPARRSSRRPLKYTTRAAALLT